jgi:hypothetical protein
VTPKAHSQISVIWEQVNAFRLARHHLSKRAPTKSLLSVSNDMTGAQAQLLSAAQISLGMRVRDLKLKDVEDVINKRKLVKSNCMRRTLFLVPAKHLATFVRGSARRAQKEINWALKKGVSERTIDKVVNATLSVLDEPLTRPEIAERVSRALGVQKRDVHGGGWGSNRKLAAVPVGHLNYPIVYLLHVVAARGVICYGAYQDNEPTFVRADAWISKWKDLSQEEAEGKLLRKYLQAYGPATEADFAIWCGISLTEAREIWSRERAGLTTVYVEGRSATILQKDLDELKNASFERPHVRLLPYFDVYLLGHKDRQHIVDKKHQSKVFRSQGWISPVVLVDGRVVGIWKHTQEKNRLLVNVEKFKPLSKQIRAAVQDEAQELGRFLSIPKVDVKIS